MAVVVASGSTQTGTYKITPKQLDFEVYHGDTFDVKIGVKDRAGSGVDLGTFTVMTGILKSDGTNAASPTLSVNDGNVLGRIRITLDTGLLDKTTTYNYFIKLIDSNGKGRTILVGDLAIV